MFQGIVNMAQTREKMKKNKENRKKTRNQENKKKEGKFNIVFGGRNNY